MKSRYLLLLLSSFLLLTGCVEEPLENPPVKNSSEYFPLFYGRFIEYQVDSIVFDDAPGGNKKDTIRFQLREEIGNTHVSLTGDTVFYIHRFSRSGPEYNWILRDVWTSYYEENDVLRKEENLIFRKMTLPLNKGLTWIGTSYINPQTSVKIGTENLEAYQYWQGKVLAIDEAAVVGTYNFGTGEVMHISQTETDDGFMKRSVHETYVRNIGLVARTDTILDSRCIELGDFSPCIDHLWYDHASKGYILYQVMIDHN